MPPGPDLTGGAKGGSILGNRNQQRRKGRTLALTAAVLIVLAGGATYGLLHPAHSVASTRPAASHPAAQSSYRTVLVAGTPLPKAPAVQDRSCAVASACHNGEGGIILVHLLQGSASERKTSGTVLSDTLCTPDRYGISHCHNEIRLADGTTVILVQEDHNMQYSPCLAPGEPVLVEPATTG